MNTNVEQVRDEVRARYAEAVTAATGGGGCCGGTDGGCGADEPAGGSGYYPTDLRAELPVKAVQASMGCGNPLRVADLRPGETVLDLGSGGGIDVLLSAGRVGPTGRAYGLDMTDEMLDLARRNAAEAGATNVEFRKGHIEDIPLDGGTVDVVISNCVINLSVDKPAVFAEMFRVLRPGGRIGVADIVAEDGLTPQQRAAGGDWASCAAGALSRQEYVAGLAAAGFADIEVEFIERAPTGLHPAVVRARRP